MGAKVQLAGRTVDRLGMSLAGLRVAGMWGEPADRDEAIRAVRRAVALGAEVLEVPVPFGPAADLLRAAEVPGAFIAARLTGQTTLDVLRSRLGRAPDLVLAEPALLSHLTGWAVPRGVVGEEAVEGVAAVRGPYPPPRALLEWCETRRIPYLAAETAVLRAGEHTIALPAPRSVTEVERAFAEEPTTPPAGGPG